MTLFSCEILLRHTIIPLLADDSQAKALTQRLTSWGIEFHVVSESDQQKDKDAWKTNLQQKTFIGMCKYLFAISRKPVQHFENTLILNHDVPAGRDCSVMITHIEEVMDLVCVGKPDEVRARYLPLWLAFKAVHDAIITVKDDEDVDAQADEVDRLAAAFGDLFQTTIPAASGGLYVHMLVSVSLSNVHDNFDLCY
jgi:hypothetical protein